MLDELDELGLSRMDHVLYPQPPEVPSLGEGIFPNVDSPLDLPSQARVSRSAVRRLCAMSPASLEAITATYGRSLLYYYLALEMREISDRLLSHMAHRRDAIFGEGSWLVNPSNRLYLDDDKREHVERALAEFDQGATISLLSLLYFFLTSLFQSTRTSGG
jgi:hypothetical protein